MKKYILMLGVAGVALGSYCAYAGNSATMTVTATIAHDVSLTVTQQFNLGTITIDPSQSQGDFVFNPQASEPDSAGGGIISVTGASHGRFTANIPNLSACPLAEDSSSIVSCGGLSISDNYIELDEDSDFVVGIGFARGSGNEFIVGADEIGYYNGAPKHKTYSGSIAINYTPES